MAKSISHGVRHGQRAIHPRLLVYRFDTKRSGTHVYLLNEDGEPVARQSRTTTGRVFRQCSMVMGNPDTKGYNAYPLEIHDQDGWFTYDSSAKKGAISSYDFQDILARNGISNG